jgi:hypothetical protein
VGHIGYRPVEPRREQSELDGIVASQHHASIVGVASSPKTAIGLYLLPFTCQQSQANRWSTASGGIIRIADIGYRVPATTVVLAFYLSILATGLDWPGSTTFFKDTAPRNGLHDGQS